MTPAMKILIVLGDQLASSQIKFHSDSMESLTFVSNSILEHVDFSLDGQEFRRMVWLLTTHWNSIDWPT